MDGRTCIDIDECIDNPRICGGGKCINTRGGHKCQCGDGLLANGDNTSCLGTKTYNSFFVKYSVHINIAIVYFVILFFMVYRCR